MPESRQSFSVREVDSSWEDRTYYSVQSVNGLSVNYSHRKLSVHSLAELRELCMTIQKFLIEKSNQEGAA